MRASNKLDLTEQLDDLETKLATEILRSVLAEKIIGDVVEFGCYAGKTSILLSKAIQSAGDIKRLWVYDSFQGLPEKTSWDQSPVGSQFRAGALAVSKKSFINNMKRANVRIPVIKKAWFSDLTSADLPDKICFAFLDGDYYQSILDSLKLIWPKLQTGAVVIVDDYSNPALPGVSRAVDRWLKDNPSNKVKLAISASLAVIKWL